MTAEQQEADASTVIREVRPEDLRFIKSSWLKSYRKADAVKGVNSDLFYNHHGQLVESLLSTCNVTVLVSREDTDQIVGWLCSAEQGGSRVLHYVYVKAPFRRLGLANKLRAAAKIDPLLSYCSHRTPVVESLGWALQYNPYLLWGQS